MRTWSFCSLEHLSTPKENNAGYFFYFHAPHYLKNMEEVIEGIRLQNRNYEILDLSNISDAELLEKHKGFFIHAHHNAIYRLIQATCRLRIICKYSIIRTSLFILLLTAWMILFLKRRQVAAMVMSDDRAIVSCIVLSACRVNNIKTILLPVESFQSTRGRILTREQQNKHVKNDFLLDIARKIYPANFKAINGKTVYWYPSYIAVVGKVLNILPDNPWVRGGNNPDIIAVNSESQLEENLKNGIPKERQVITGFPMHDVLVGNIEKKHVIKGEICATYRCDLKKKVFLIVGTNYGQLFSGTYFPKAYTETRRAVQLICDALSREYTIIFKVHPRERKSSHIDFLGKDLADNLIFVEKEYDIYQLLAISDIVFMFISSVVIGTLATDAPILTYDLCGLKHFQSFYRNFKSISKITSYEELKSILSKKNNDKLDFHKTQDCREGDRASFAVFDGNSTSRILALLQ